MRKYTFTLLLLLLILYLPTSASAACSAYFHTDGYDAVITMIQVSPESTSEAPVYPESPLVYTQVITAGDPSVTSFTPLPEGTYHVTIFSDSVYITPFILTLPMEHPAEPGTLLFEVHVYPKYIRFPAEEEIGPPASVPVQTSTVEAGTATADFSPCPQLSDFTPIRLYVILLLFSSSLLILIHKKHPGS